MFLTLHTIGVAYTYSRVPFGGWMQQALHLDRNHFDRIVHFSFGFLLAYPSEEWFRMFTSVRGWLSYYLPVMTILGLSGPQKDMTLAIIGALITVGLTAGMAPSAGPVVRYGC